MTRAKNTSQLLEKDVAKYVKQQVLFFYKLSGKMELLSIKQAQEIYESEMPVERIMYLKKIKEFLNAGSSQIARQKYEELNAKLNESPRSKRSSLMHPRVSIREKSQMEFNQLHMLHKENQKSSLKEHLNDQKTVSKFSQPHQRNEIIKHSTIQSMDTKKSKLKKTGKYNSMLNVTSDQNYSPVQIETTSKQMYLPLLEQGTKKKKFSKSVKISLSNNLSDEKSTLKSQRQQEDDLSNQDSRVEYILQLKMHLLKSQKPKDANVQKLLIEKEEATFNKYDLVYSHRYQKTQKQYIAYQNQISKRNRIIEQQEEEQDQIYDDFISNIKQGIDMKTRATDNENKIRKKYFRQPKIYQNDYIDMLYLKKKFRYFHTIPDSTSKKHVILFIFFTEKKEFFLLLGRRSNENEFENSSSGSKSSCNGSDKQDQNNKQPDQGSIEAEPPKELSPLEKLIQQRKIEEEQRLKAENPEESDADDDSPYFVKITLDEMFLSHLQMPDIISGADVEHRYENIIHNEIFRQIVQREITMMFGEGDNESHASDSDADKGKIKDKDSDNRHEKLIQIDKIDRDVIDEADEINLYRTGIGSEKQSGVGSSNNSPHVLEKRDGKAVVSKDNCTFISYNQQLIEQKEIEQRKLQEKQRAVEDQMKKFLGSYSNILTNS